MLAIDKTSWKNQDVISVKPSDFFGVVKRRFTVRRGSTRRVLVIGPIAFKLARRSARGAGQRCNRYEADLYWRAKLWLCPVIACSRNGALLVARAATPLTQSEFDEVRKNDGLPDWDYHPLDGDGECPFEFHKRDDWGWLDGKPVAVDYAAPAIADTDEIKELMRNLEP